MDISAEILAARQAAGLSIRELAAKAGVSPSTVSRVESGRSDPSVSLASRILAALDLQLVVDRGGQTRPSDVLRSRGHLLRHLAEDAYGLRNIRVFGSVARGEDAPGSDVDLLADTPDTFGTLQLAKFRRDATELLGGIEVDLVDDFGDSDVLAHARREAVAL